MQLAAIVPVWASKIEGSLQQRVKPRNDVICDEAHADGALRMSGVTRRLHSVRTKYYLVCSGSPRATVINISCIAAINATCGIFVFSAARKD